MSLPKIKITQMSSASTLNASDVLVIVQGGVNKKTSVTNFLKNLNSVDSIRVNPVQLAIDFSVATKNDANSLFVDGSTDKVGVGTDLPESKLHVKGNFQVGSATTDGIMVQSTEGIIYTVSDQTNSVTKAISPSRAGTIIDCNTGVAGLFSLSSGSNGQIKTIAVNTLNIGKTATISLVGSGFNTITFNAIGNTVVLQYFVGMAKWCVIGGNGAVLSTV